MWFLYALQNDQKQTRTLLRPNQKYTLGRRDADILPPVIDKSISRRHATINVEAFTMENWKQVDWVPSVWCHDLGSKFGSFVNSNKLKGLQLEQGAKLKDGDILRIGTKAAFFQLAWEPLIICRQALTQVEKQKLYSAALQVGAKITQSVRSPYTHLLMSNIRISFKLARCLADGKPIISQSWLDALVDESDTDFQFPPVSGYAPPIDASCNGPQGIPDFTPNPRRAQLLAGKRFIFFEEDQYQQLSQMVGACSGNAILLNLNKTDPFDEQLDDDNTIVIDCGQLQDTTAGKNVIHALDSFERRTIDSMEICWAILYCSTDIQCNTDVNMAASNLISHNSNVQASHSSEAGPHDRPTSDLPAMSGQAGISSAGVRSPLSPSPPLTQNHTPSNQHDRGRTTSVRSPLERSEEKDLDLDDIFDQLVGDDEPSRPPPAPKNFQPKPSTSRPTTSNSVDSGSRTRHQNHPEEAPTTTPATNQQRRSVEKDDNDVFGTSEVAVPRRLTRDSQDSSPQKELPPGPSTKRQREDDHQDANPRRNKGKERMYDPPILNADDQTEPSVIDGVEEPSPNSRAQKRRKAIRKEVDDPTTKGYTPYTLPELENENVGLVPGKCYTKVEYMKLVAVPNSPATRLLPEPSHQINYKTFKKAVHPLPSNPLSVVNMATEVPLDVRGPGNRSPVTVENDYSDIRIRSNVSSRARMRF